MWKVIVLLLCVVSVTTVGSGMEVVCSIICGDLNQDTVFDYWDYATGIGFIGEAPTELSLECLDAFTADDYQDANDVILWAQVTHFGQNTGNVCAWKAVDPVIMVGPHGGSESTFTPSGGTGYGSSLLIAGKKNTATGTFSIMDKLYVFNSQGNYVSSPFSPVTSPTSGRITCGYDGKVNQVDSDIGLNRLNDGISVVTKGGVTATCNEPRYNSSAVVYIGMQTSGSGYNTNYAGRPILDAAIDAQGYIYVVPVTVVPSSCPSNGYLAAAKLQSLPGQTPCYSVVKIYDDGIVDNHDPTRIGLKEIEVDAQGNVYIISACRTNSSNFLWAYLPSGALATKVALDTIPGVSGGIPDPIALHASRKSSVVYLSSGYKSPTATSAKIYALSTENLALTLSRTVQINGMGHVSGITENPNTGVVWVTGFKLENIPQYFNPSVASFYHPYLAQVPATGSDPVTASLITSSDLALPISITWIPASLISSSPPTGHTLWRNQKNTFRLTFDGDITAPESGNILIQEMQNDGQFGSDVSSGFTFTVENDANSHPRILKIRETASTLSHRKWYAVRNTGSWKGVANFEVQYPTQRGDANDDGQVNTDDYSFVWADVPTLSCSDDCRKDINGDGKILAGDSSVINAYKPSTAVDPPSGH